MSKECADCGNERIMVCPSCNPERSNSDEAELRQLRKEVAAFRSLAAQVDKEVTGLRKLEVAIIRTFIASHPKAIKRNATLVKFLAELEKAK